MSIRDLPPILPASTLAQRAQLPLKPAPVTLTGQIVRLEPLVVERDAAALFAASVGEPARLSLMASALTAIAGQYPRPHQLVCGNKSDRANGSAD